MNSVEILNQCAAVQTERGKEYGGDRERSFNQVATAFNAITRKNLTPAEVALLLQIVKDVRQWSADRLHVDSVIDGVSYGSLKGELLFEQYDKKEAAA